MELSKNRLCECGHKVSAHDEDLKCEWCSCDGGFLKSLKAKFSINRIYGKFATKDAFPFHPFTPILRTAKK